MEVNRDTGLELEETQGQNVSPVLIHLHYTLFFYKHHVYKNVEAQISKKVYPTVRRGGLGQWR